MKPLICIAMLYDWVEMGELHYRIDMIGLELSVGMIGLELLGLNDRIGMIRLEL